MRCAVYEMCVPSGDSPAPHRHSASAAAGGGGGGRRASWRDPVGQCWEGGLTLGRVCSANTPSELGRRREEEQGEHDA
jgi:hypothetical protein